MPYGKLPIGEMALKFNRDLFKCINSTLSLLCSELGQKQDQKLHRNHYKGIMKLNEIKYINLYSTNYKELHGIS